MTLWRVSVPGSSANLGAGFDTLALALEVFLKAAAGPRPAAAGKARVKLSGPHIAGLPTDDSNLVWQAFSQTFRKAGKDVPDWKLELDNEIPLGRGLGSSGAAAVAGVALANAAGNLELSETRVIALAAEIEGHPDNVAASALGGLAVAVRRSGGDMTALSLPWPREISILLAIPELELPTAQARAVLPPNYSREDAVFNLQRAALLVAAVASRQPSAFSTALEDRWHQPYRQSLVPGLAEALALRLPGLLGAALSGAGPSLIAFATDPAPASAAIESIYKRLGIPCRMRVLAAAPQGVTYSRAE